jgi:hypothetical protein
LSILTVLPPFLFSHEKLLISTISLWTKLESSQTRGRKTWFPRVYQTPYDQMSDYPVNWQRWLIISSSWQLGPWPEWKTIITLSEVFARIAQQPSLLFKIVKSKCWTRAYHRVIAGWVTRKTKTKWKWKNMKTFLK